MSRIGRVVYYCLGMSSALLALALLALYALPLARALRSAPPLRSDAEKVALLSVPSAR